MDVALGVAIFMAAFVGMALHERRLDRIRRKRLRIMRLQKKLRRASNLPALARLAGSITAAMLAFGRTALEAATEMTEAINRIGRVLNVNDDRIKRLQREIEVHGSTYPAPE